MLVASVLISVFVMVLSEILHNNIAMLAIVTGLIILCMICSVPPQHRVLSQMFDWLPSTFVSPWNIFDVRTLPIFGHYLTAWQAAPIIYILISIGIVITGKKVYRHYQVSGR